MSEVTIAVECTKAIDELIGNSEVKNKYAQRARSLLTQLFSLGVAHVISIAAARSNRNAVEVGLKSDRCNEVVDKVGKGTLKDEEKSYALYGAVLLYALKRLGYIRADNLADALLELHGSVADTVAYKQADWLKRLAEAYFK